MRSGITSPLLVNRAKPESEILFGLDPIFKTKKQSEQQHEESTAMMLTRIALVLLSIPAGVFYKKYAEKCIQDGLCAYPLSAIHNTHLKTEILEISGGGGFSGTSIALGMFAASTLYASLQQSKSTAMKMALITGSTLWVGASVFQMILGSLGSIDKNESVMEPNNAMIILFPALAVIPSALFNAAINLPGSFRWLKNIFSCRDSLKPEIKAFYRKQHEAFLEKIQRKWNMLEAGLEDFLWQPKNDNQLYFLNSLSFGYPLRSRVKDFFELIGKFAGLYFGGMFAGTLIWNMYEQTGKFPALQNLQVVSIGLGLLSLKGYLKITSNYFVPEPKIIKKLYPGRVALAAFLITLWQLPSYSAVVMLSEHLLPTFFLKTPAVISAAIGVITYHISGLLDLTLMIAEKRLSNEDVRYMVSLEKKVKQLLNLSLDEFITAVQTMHEAERTTFELQLYTQVHTDINEEKLPGPKKKGSWCGRLFGYSKENADLEVPLEDIKLNPSNRA